MAPAGPSKTVDGGCLSLVNELGISTMASKTVEGRVPAASLALRVTVGNRATSLQYLQKSWVDDHKDFHNFLDFLFLLVLSGPQRVKSLLRAWLLMDLAKFGKWKLEVNLI